MNREENLDLNVAPTLFVEFHGITTAQLSEVLGMAEEICRAQGCLEFRPGLGRAERDRIFKARHGLGETIIRNHPGCRVLSTDVAVPNGQYPELIKTIRSQVEAHKIVGYTISHAGDGNVHLVVAGKKGDQKEWDKIDRVVNTVVTRALELGGTATGEHGVGIGKRKYMPTEHGSSLQWMQRVKSLFDPNGILNPGKIFP
jgi:D-lactate dehydrogenase (cytochrome)